MSDCPYQRSGTAAGSDPCDSSTNLPDESILQREGSDTANSLPTERSASTIPRSEASTWLYPSPRMFYNALHRKGFDTAPEDIHSMLQVHNFLNEQVWKEILQWEEAGGHAEEARICGELRLKRFMGRPQELSPKARLCGWLFGTPKPFDRHDWTVSRCGKEVRYVIDYYAAGESGPLANVFYVDVRPALDSFDAFYVRSKKFILEKLKGNAE